MKPNFNRLKITWLFGLILLTPLFAQAQFQIKQLSVKIGSYPPDPKELVSLNDSIYMLAKNGSNTYYLAVSDGVSDSLIYRPFTWAGKFVQVSTLHKIKDRLIIGGLISGETRGTFFTFNPADGSIQKLIDAPYRPGYWMSEQDANGNQYFMADSSGYLMLVKSNGQAGNIQTVFHFTMTTYINGEGKYAFDGNTFYYVPLHPTLGYEIFKVDLTTQTEVLLKDINPANNTNINDAPSKLYVYEGRLYFGTYQDNQVGFEPWVSDGTTAGTKIIGDLYFGSFTSNLQSFRGFNGKVFFFADSRPKDSTARGIEPHVYDPAAHFWFRLRDINPGAGNSIGLSNPWVDEDGKLFFSASDTQFGKNQIWITDGTTQGTQLWLKGSDFGPDVHIYQPELSYRDGYIFVSNGGYAWIKKDKSKVLLIEDAYYGKPGVSFVFKDYLVGVGNILPTQGKQVVSMTPLAPNLGPDTVICGGSSITLKPGFSAPNYTNVWQDGSSGDQFLVDSSGIYWVDMFNQDKSTYFGRDSVQVTVEQHPFTLGPDRETRFPLALIVPLSGSFVWSTGSIDSFAVIGAPGIYWVKYTNAAGCTYYDTIELKLLNSIQIENPVQVTLYPNPVKGGQNLHLKSDYVAKITGISLMQMDGKVIRLWDAPQESLPLPMLAPGNYAVKIEFEDQRQVVTYIQIQ